MKLFISLSENEDKKINYILAHIDEFTKKDMLDFIEKLLTDGQRNTFKTNYRKLFMAYSLMYEWNKKNPSGQKSLRVLFFGR